MKETKRHNNLIQFINRKPSLDPEFFFKYIDKNHFSSYYCWVTKYPKTQWLKKKTVIILLSLMISVGQNSGRAELGGDSGLQCLMRLQSDGDWTWKTRQRAGRTSLLSVSGLFHVISPQGLLGGFLTAGGPQAVMWL